ncbi:alpha/beta hydrolase [bacterium]|nr:alpha/beta hydrolase [bacterium]
MRSLFVTIVVLLSGVTLWYRRWLMHHTKKASAESYVIQTARGPVEADMRGNGPVVLHFHGGNVGHNGWFMLAHLLDKGFQVLTPDRPGYLGTPLAENNTPEAQADLMAALLDELNVERVAVIGVSAGGPGALQFALRHPSRTCCLVLLSAITKRTTLTDDQLNSTLGKLVMTRRFQNPAYFLIHQAMTRIPKLALRDFVQTETTYTPEQGQHYINQIMADPEQRRQVQALANAIVPALPRFDGVMNDLEVQQSLDDLPLERIDVPTLIVHSRNDGDVPYENATFAARTIPNAELITVDQFGHFVWWARSRSWSAVVRLARGSGQSSTNGADCRRWKAIGLSVMPTNCARSNGRIYFRNWRSTVPIK